MSPVLGEIRQELEAEIGREHHSDDPGGNQREADHPENAAGVFAGARLGEADRQEARGSDQRAGQHRECGRGPGVGRRSHPIPSLLHLHHHHFDGDDRVVDEQPESNDQRAERDPVQVEPGAVHDEKHDGENERHRQRDDNAGTPAERQEAHDQDNGERLSEALDEFRHQLVDDMRLIGDLGDLDADRQLSGDGLHRLLQVLAESDDVRAVRHRDAEPEGWLAAFAHDEGRRVLVAALDRGDIAEPEHPPVRLHRHGGDGLGAGECASDPHIDAVGRRIDRSAGDDGVLLGNAVEDLLGGYAEGGELCVAELDENLLRALADDINLVDVGNAQQGLADVLGTRLELGEAQTIRRQHIDHGIDVTVFVIKIRADDAGRQIAPDVTHLLAHLVPKLLDLGGWSSVREENLDEGDTRLRIALHAVEVGQVLQLLFDLSATCVCISAAVAPGQATFTIIVLIVKEGSSARPRLK